MKIALRVEFKLTKGAQTADIIRAVYLSFAQAQLNSPVIRFTMEDSSGNKTSSVERVCRQYPCMGQFDHLISRPWGIGGEVMETRRIGNDIDSPMTGLPVELSKLIEIAAGIPKRFPFFRAAVRIADLVFGEEPTAASPLFWPGLTISDGWGQSRREIGLTGLAIVEADLASKSPPTLAGAVDSVLRGCGSYGRVQHIVLPGQKPDAREQAAAIQRAAYRRLGDTIVRARLPHDIPYRDDHPPWQPAGPRKPVLAAALGPLGYTCRGNGMMHLVCSRRTTSNMTVSVHVDFGTWHKQVAPTYSVRGLGFSIAIGLPGQPFPAVLEAGQWVVDETRWRQIAENLAALVAELDRSELKTIEEAMEPSPPWYVP